MTARYLWLVLVVLLATACGDDEGGAAIDASPVPPDVDIAACGAIGTACGPDCANDLECLDTGVCAPIRGTCGGFTGEPCQDTTLTCAYPQGSTAGICLRPDEKACLCAVAPGALDDCTSP